MTDEIRRKLDMARRARAFLASRPADSAPMRAVVDRFLARVERAEAFHRQAVVAERRRLAALARRAAAARELNDAVGAMAGNARFAGMTTGIADLHLARPRRVQDHRDYLEQVQVVIRVVEAHPAEMRAASMSSTLPPTVRRLYQEYADALTARDRAVLDRVGAIAGLSAAVAEIMESVRNLDVVLKLACRDDAGAFAAWRSARRIHWSARHHSGRSTATGAGHPASQHSAETGPVI
jgi:hypothetical protein